MKKAELINAFTITFGDGYIITEKQTIKQPKKLKCIAKAYIQSKLPKQFLNASLACYRYPTELHKWNNSSAFSLECKVAGTQCPPFWYSQQKFLQEESSYILEFLDPEHLLTNMRTKICSTGIPQAGIKADAWVEVAKNGKENGSNLSLAMVQDLLDKQNVGYALKTFSVEVEMAMTDAGYLVEADFCRIFRNWYIAQDEAGISCTQRHEFEQEFRQWLLNGVRFDVFPLEGRYVKDIPVILFEGLLLHIDRRSQLYTFTDPLFDMPERKTTNPKRKRGTITSLNEPAKGSNGIRAERYKVDESKILPHVQAGILLDDNLT
ncbi:Hypothetical predicted protein [Mytilus galloprovincialis]|uniref:Uncharacterized protein n=1 Tax=Mytilus galloprovincialis TaxID=29158 RepID=A0A8B6GTQ5_MYTGA|nr:Hypothetical predicted protein [Mytilus galloprovincialis]